MKPVSKHFARLVGMAWMALAFYCSVGVGGIVLPVSGNGIAYAQAENQQQERKTRRTPAMREKIYKVLSEAQLQAEAEKYAEALKTITDLRADPTLNSYEKAMTWNFTAYIYSAQGKYPEAIRAYEQVLAQPDLPEALELSSVFTMATLYLGTDEVTKAIASLKKWFSLTTTPTPQAYYLLGQAYYMQEDYKQAIASVEKGIALVRSQGGQPQEQPLLVLRASYFDLNNMDKVLEVLELLVNLYPKAQYFSQLSILYGERGNEQKQLLTLEAAYDGGYLNTQAQYITLFSLLVAAEVPYKAAKILAEGLDKEIVKETVNNLRLLAQAWLLAQEPRKAITILTKAAKDSEDGELYIRLGRSYADLDEWKECTDAIRSGLKKGKVERVDSAYVMLGICLFNTDDLDGAIDAFEHARKDERSSKLALQWMTFLRNEKDRRQRIANSLL